MTHDWDASTYDRISDPQARWGRGVVSRLALNGSEAVLDAGCGTGRVTEMVLARLPKGRVTGLDGSPAMAAEALARLGSGAGGRLAVVVADLQAPLPLATATFDSVISTATFHWVPDHDALFAELARVLRPGGQLVAQCGGEGNIASVVAAAGAVFPGEDHPWNYQSPSDTAARLARSGFVETECWLSDEYTPYDDRAAMEQFMATVILWPWLTRRPQPEHAGLVRQVADRLPAQALDYVRLNIVARRAPE